MSDTRPSGHPLLPAQGAPVFQEVAEVDPHRRINLLQRWISRFDWLKDINKKEVDALMVFSEPGLLRLRPWEPDGPRLLQLYQTLSAAPHDSEQKLQDLRSILDKYERLKIDNEHRPYLGDPALAHLGLPLHRGAKSIVYVAIYPEYIAIMSQEYRNKKLILGTQVLDDFPV
jgi:hypothetical protein